MKSKTIIGVAEKSLKKYWVKHFMEIRMEKLIERIQSHQGTYGDDLREELSILYKQGFVDGAASKKSPGGEKSKSNKITPSGVN